MDRRIDTVCVTLHCTERPRDLIEKIQVWPPSSLLLQPCRYSAIEQVSVTSPTACVLIECSDQHSDNRSNSRSAQNQKQFLSAVLSRKVYSHR